MAGTKQNSCSQMTNCDYRKQKCQQLKTMPKRLRLKIHRISMQMADEIRTKLKNKDRQTEVLRQQNKPGPPFHPWSSRRGRGGRAVLSAVVHVHTPLNGVPSVRTMPMRAERCFRRESQKLNSDTKGMKKECIKRS